MPTRICQRHEACLAAYLHSDREGLQAQGLHVDPAPHGGVCGVEHLEPTIEQEAFNDVSALPAADPVRGFQNDDVTPGVAQRDRRPEPREPGTDDDDVVLGPCHAHPPDRGCVEATAR